MATFGWLHVSHFRLLFFQQRQRGKVHLPLYMGQFLPFMNWWLSSCLPSSVKWSPLFHPIFWSKLDSSHVDSVQFFLGQSIVISLFFWLISTFVSYLTSSPHLIMINRILHKVPYGTPFISLAFAIRTFEGVAAAAFLNASYTIMAGEFPERVATIFVSLF